MVCVRRQQSRLSPPFLVSFQHLPTLSHNTLEKANALFVPLLTGEGTRTLKSQFCSGTQPWGDAPQDEGEIWVGCSGYPQPLLTLPTLTSSHKFIPPPKLRATKFRECCFGSVYLPLTSFGELFFAPLHPAHGPAITAAPHRF